MGATLMRRSNTLIPLSYFDTIGPVFDWTDRVGIETFTPCKLLILLVSARTVIQDGLNLELAH
jgi:hypothetical protein